MKMTDEELTRCFISIDLPQQAIAEIVEKRSYSLRYYLQDCSRDS